MAVAASVQARILGPTSRAADIGGSVPVVWHQNMTASDLAGLGGYYARPQLAAPTSSGGGGQQPGPCLDCTPLPGGTTMPLTPGTATTGPDTGSLVKDLLDAFTSAFGPQQTGGGTAPETVVQPIGSPASQGSSFSWTPIVVLAGLGALGWFGWKYYKKHHAARSA